MNNASTVLNMKPHYMSVTALNLLSCPAPSFHVVAITFSYLSFPFVRFYICPTKHTNYKSKSFQCIPTATSEISAACPSVVMCLYRILHLMHGTTNKLVCSKPMVSQKKCGIKLILMQLIYTCFRYNDGLMQVFRQSCYSQFSST